MTNLSKLALPLALLVGLTPLSAKAVGASSATTSAKKHSHKKRARRGVTSAAHTRVTSRTTGRSVALTTTQAGVIHSDSSTPLRVAVARRRRGHRVFVNPWTEPTFADSTVGDNLDGEDLVVRKAAVDALGPYNGTVVVADPQTGRVLTIVNQKLALKGAFQPCSTVKVIISLASLSEKIVKPGTSLRLSRRSSTDMTQALALSNNLYFAKLGQELGFDRVYKYAKLFGLGEKAGLNIPGEEPGYLATEPPETGVGMMTSFGDGIRLTPLELASIVGTISNGGTMYYLQYPKSQEEVQNFVPRIKRTLDIADLIPEIKPGMMAAVEYGTARRANFDPTAPVFGKTGTCTDTLQPGVHLGWFGSFNDVGKNKLAVVVLLTGGRGISGPIASGVAGNVYRYLSDAHYFNADAALPGLTQPMMPMSLVAMQNCCRR